MLLLGIRRVLIYVLGKIEGAKGFNSFMASHAHHFKGVESGFPQPPALPAPQTGAEGMLRLSMALLLDGCADKQLVNLLAG